VNRLCLEFPFVRAMKETWVAAYSRRHFDQILMIEELH
jgi:hypothetical protein